VLNTRLEIRPHLFSFLFLVITHWLLLAARDGARRPLWALPPLFLLWANPARRRGLRPAALFCYLLAEALRFRPGKRGNAPARATCSGRWPSPAALAAAACLLNPNGLDALLYPLELLRLDPLIYANIIE